MIKLHDILDHFKKQLQNPKKRLRYFLISLVLIYFVWAFLILNPVLNTKKELTAQIQQLQSLLTDTTQRIDGLTEAVKSKSIQKGLEEKKQMEQKIQQTDQAIASSRYLFISNADWVALKKEIVRQQLDMDANITLMSITDAPVKPWVPQLVDKTAAGVAHQEHINQHELELKFQADYFSAVKYISRLEKLPWRVYWDHLDYRVVTYPKAEITVKFHIFTHEISEG